MGDTDPPHVAVCLSGGGHRASLFGLGALLYLVDADKAAEVASVSSVSGGSLTNAWVGLHSDLSTVEPAEFDELAARFGRRIARGGTLWATWHVYAFLLAVVVLVAGAVVGSILLPAPWSWLVWVLALPLLGLVLRQRSRVARAAFERALFGGATLDAMHGSVDHVLCAADLQTAEQVYFSGRFVYSWRTGFGTTAGLHLAAAAQASAALPFAFTPVSLPTGPHQFAVTPAFPRFLLADGGVYDNMGTEWAMRAAEGFAAEARPPTPPPHPIDEVIVVNASAGKRPGAKRLARIPLVGELASLLAVIDVLYDQTTAVRRRLLNVRYQVADHAATQLPGEALRGATVQIDRSPYELADGYARFHDAAGRRAAAVLTTLDAEGRDVWQRIADDNRKVATKLSKLPTERAAALVRHGYVLTMASAHVLLDYPLLPLPTADRSQAWVGG